MRSEHSWPKNCVTVSSILQAENLGSEMLGICAENPQATDKINTP